MYCLSAIRLKWMVDKTYFTNPNDKRQLFFVMFRKKLSSGSESFSGSQLDRQQGSVDKIRYGGGDVPLTSLSPDHADH